MTAYGVGIVGTGHAMPRHIDTNEELCKTLDGDVTPAWILEKTGIQRRFLAADTDSTSGFSIEAASKALKMAGVDPKDIGLIVVCTFSPDYILPPVSAKVQNALGAVNAQIFDIQANCAGFVTGLTTASDRMRVDPSVKFALVIGAELHTRYISRRDVNTAIYFSDGAGAAVLGQVPAGEGIIASAFFTDSSNYDSVRLRGGGSSFPLTGRQFDPAIDYLEQNGLATWKQAITHLPPTMRKVCEKAGMTLKDIDFFLFHQASLSLVQYVVKKAGQSLEKTHTNVEQIGNTGAASIGVVLSEAVNLGKLKRGQNVLFAGVGAGFNFGALICKWSVDLPATGKSVAQEMGIS